MSCGARLQDDTLIRSLVAETAKDYANLEQRVANRLRELDGSKRDIDQFKTQYDTHDKWIETTAAEHFGEGLVVAVEADGIKEQLRRHQKFAQHQLSAKQTQLDAVRRMANALRDLASNEADRSALEQMMKALQAKWRALSDQSTERERALYDALLAAGKYKDAMAALIDWLRHAQTELSDGLCMLISKLLLHCSLTNI